MRLQNVSRKFINKLSHYKVKCKTCGHTMIMINVPSMICQYCGNKVYKNAKEEFKDKIKKEIKK